MDNFAKDTRSHHIHVVLYGSDEWNNYINFRDYLNSSIEATKVAKVKYHSTLQYALQDCIMFPWIILQEQQMICVD